MVLRAFFFGALACVACQSSSEAAPSKAGPSAPSGQGSKTTSKVAPTPPSPNLGVTDKGIFPDLDQSVQLRLSAELKAAEVSASWDEERQLLVLYREGWPVKVYPTRGSRSLRVGGDSVHLRPGDYAELSPLLRGKSLARVEAKSARASDRDEDGIPDALDILIGAHKTVINGASYGGGYQKIAYPWGDLPRDQGVCTDVVVRALRNAGVDIQSELQRDIKRRPAAFPMVKKPNPNIDHRRVKTLLPYFERQYQEHSIELVDQADPYRPGDVIFMDTFPSRSGPDHIGIVSDSVGESGLPLVVNNWTDGSHTAELDLLGWVPVTHRFRLRDRPKTGGD